MVEVLVGSLVALVSACVGWAITHHWQKKNYRSSAESNLEQWTSEVRLWSGQVVAVMNRLHWQFEATEADSVVDSSAGLALDLSCLIEQGRLFFPNGNRDVHGQDRQPSRSGYRSPILDPVVAAVAVARGVSPEFDFADPKVKYGRNRHSKALRLYINAFLSMTERVLMVRAGNRSLVERVSLVAGADVAREVEVLLFPSDENAPPGHRYWLGEVSGPHIPNEGRVFGTQS